MDNERRIPHLHVNRFTLQNIPMAKTSTLMSVVLTIHPCHNSNNRDLFTHNVI